MSVLERCPYLRDVRIREVSVLERCPYSMLYRCLYSIRKIFVLVRVTIHILKFSISFFSSETPRGLTETSRYNREDDAPRHETDGSRYEMPCEDAGE